MKEKFESLLEIIKGLLKYPVVFILVIFLFILSIIQELIQTNKWVLLLQLIGIIIIAALCAVILITDKNGRKYINKIGIFSFFWFASCVVLVDFSNFSFETLVRIITSYEFIFLGCLIPDYFSQIENERDNKIKKMEERLSALEKNAKSL